MNTEYYILSPTGNITALVTSPVPKKDYFAVSSQIMALHPEVEQVGFTELDGASPVLRMAGGEFCGNATMCAASLYCKLNGIGNINTCVTVSGADKPVSVQVTEKDGTYYCDILLKKPNCIKEQIFEINNKEYKLPMVSMEGISHIIADYGFDKKTAEALLKKYSEKTCVSAMGIMLYDAQNQKMRPIVYVKDCNTLFYENSCASGSCALGAYLAEQNAGNINLGIIQPGGALIVRTEKKSDFIGLSGKVNILQKNLRSFSYDR